MPDFSGAIAIGGGLAWSYTNCDGDITPNFKTGDLLR